jgi:hypothetical protein
MRSIEPVHCGPAVAPVTHIRRHALLTRDADEAWNDAVITVAMDRWRKAYHRHARATRRQRRGCHLRRDAGKRVGVERGHDVFHCDATWRLVETDRGVDG